MMREALTLTVISLALAIGGQAHAELWCGHGPGTLLDHPCSDEDTWEDPSVAAAVEKHSNEWMAVAGVWQVRAGTSQTGTPMEIRIYVEPRQIATAKDQIPSEVEGIPISLIPKKTPTATALLSFGVGFFNNDGYDSETAERLQKARAAEAAYYGAIQNFGEQWNDLPGVINVGPGKSKAADCDFHTIRITVQAQFLNDVKEQIPNTVNGLRVIFIPSDDDDE